MLSLRGGVGSTPELNCPEEDAALQAMLALPPLSAEALGKQTLALTACRARLIASGIDPNAYGFDAAAADYRDLLRVLHIRRANLWASAGGSVLVFDLMRQYPQLVRSVTLEDPHPPGSRTDGRSIVLLSQALNRYAALCDANKRCHAAFPDLRGQADGDYALFQRNPVTVNIIGNPPTPILVDGDRLAEASEYALSNPVLLPYLASAIYTPDPNLFASAIEDWSRSPEIDVPSGSYYSQLCKDYLPVSARVSEGPAALSFPQFAGVDLIFQLDLRACAAWNVQPDDPSDFAPIVSDIPTFLFGGSLNPMGSPTWFTQIARGLTHATVLTFPTLTAFVVQSSSAPACLTGLRLDFLRHPLAHLDVSSCEISSPPIPFVGSIVVFGPPNAQT